MYVYRYIFTGILTNISTTIVATIVVILLVAVVSIIIMMGKGRRKARPIILGHFQRIVCYFGVQWPMTTWLSRALYDDPEVAAGRHTSGNTEFGRISCSSSVKVSETPTWACIGGLWGIFPGILMVQYIALF